MQMTFGRMSEPLTKVQKVDSTKTAQSYDFMYKYEDSNHPTAPTQIGHEHYTKDGTYVFTNTVRTDNIYIISNYKIIGGSRNKTYYKVWGRIKIDDKNHSLSPQAYSRVYTNVLYRKGYDTSKLKNNAVSNQTDLNMN